MAELPNRPIGVTFASVYLIVMGLLMVVAGGACTLYSAGFLGPDQLVDSIASVLTAVWAAMFVLGILSIIGGAGTWTGWSWARWLGVMTSVLAIAGLGAWVVLYLAAGASITTRLVEIAIIVLYGITILSLLRAKSWFRTDPVVTR